MLKQNKNRIRFVLLLLVTAVFSGVQIRNTDMLKSEYKAVSIRLFDEKVTLKGLEKALKEEKGRESRTIPEITAWTQGSRVQIKNRTLKRAVSLSPVIVSGNMALAAPMNLICGNYVYKNDRYGCVIDTDTAYKLFGMEKAEGNIVIYNKKSYHVRGVVKTNHPIFLIQESENGSEYSNLELLYKNKERGEAYARDFIFQNGLAADYIVIDGYFYSRVLSLAVCLPLWAFFAAAAGILIRCYLRKRSAFKKPECIMYGIAGLLMLAGCGMILYQFTGMPFYYPEKFIPTKWSDFDYWTNQYKLIKEQILQIRYLAPNSKDVLLEDMLIKLPYRFGIMVTLCLLDFLSMNLLIKTSQIGQFAKQIKNSSVNTAEDEKEKLTA